MVSDKINQHGQIQNILAAHGYENTDWFFNMVLCVFIVKTNYSILCYCNPVLFFLSMDDSCNGKDGIEP